MYDTRPRPLTRVLLFILWSILLRGIWEASERHLKGFWEASERHLSWKTSERHLRSWEASERHLGGIWEASGRHLGTAGRHLGAGVALGGIWVASWRYLGGIWEVSGRHLRGDRPTWAPRLPWATWDQYFVEKIKEKYNISINMWILRCIFEGTCHQVL